MKNTSTGEPVKEQAPAPSTEQPKNIPEDTPGTAKISNNGQVLDSYLVGGYFRGEGKIRYSDPALVDQAEQIAAELATGGVTPTAFNRMVKALKGAAKLPYAAQQGALKKLMPQVLDQERRKKAPPLLREIVEANRAAVKNGEDFAACLEHFRDIAIYIAAQSRN